MSQAQQDTVILAVTTVKLFRSMVKQRVEIFKAPGKDKDLRTVTFARAGARLLTERLNDNSAALLANVRDLILIIGAFIDKELDPSLSPQDHDKTLIQTTELFMAVLRGALQQAEPRSTVNNHPILNDEQQLSGCLSAFMKGDVKGDSRTSLSNWVRVVFEVRKQDHNLAVADTRRGCNEKIAFAELKTYTDDVAQNRCSGATPSDFQSREAYEAWKRMESRTLAALMNVFTTRFPNVQNQKVGGLHNGIGRRRLSMKPHFPTCHTGPVHLQILQSSRFLNQTFVSGHNRRAIFAPLQPPSILSHPAGNMSKI